MALYRTTRSCMIPLAVLVALLFDLAPGTAAAQEPQQQRPNIILIMSDDFGAHSLGAYELPYGVDFDGTTPTLDRLAEQGMLFTNCFVTNSLCGPSRAVVLTGKYSHINGFLRNGMTFDASQPTFPKILQDAGYHTAVVGKWHLGTRPRGFDYWSILPGQGDYYNPEFKVMGERRSYKGHTAEIIADMALNYMKNIRPEDEPFMLLYWHKASHRPWYPPLNYLQMYADRKMPVPDTLFTDWEGKARPAHVQEMTIAEHLNKRDLCIRPPNTLTQKQLERWKSFFKPRNQGYFKLEGKQLTLWKYQRYIKNYLRCIAAMDHNIGRVLDYLEKSGLSENTIVIFTADNGMFLGDHGWFDKRWMYEESLRIPLIVRYPGHVEPGSKSDEIVLNLDFAETILDYAGVPIPDAMQGRSLRPILEGHPPEDWRESMYYQYYEFPAVHMVHKQLGVRTHRYKLINFYEIGQWEFYDLKKDAEEVHNRYGDPHYADVIRRLKREIKRLRKKYDADHPNHLRYYLQTQAEDVPTELVLRYDFALTTGGTVRDLSGNEHSAKLPQAASTVIAREGSTALKLTGQGFVRVGRELDPSVKPLTVGAWIKPMRENGVIMSRGGVVNGYTLYLKDGRAYFGVRSGGELGQVVSPDPIPSGEWTHLVGVINRDGTLKLYVNGAPVDSGGENWFIMSNPNNILTIGADSHSHVGPYDSNLLFKGLMEDVRVYWGTINQSVLSSWAG